MSISFGNNPSPSDISLYLDQLTTQTVGNYKSTLTDNIGAMNALLKKIMSGGQYVSETGGLYIQEPLMYELAKSNWYSKNDELSVQGVDGVTAAQFDWANMAIPITYDMPTILKNRGSSKLIDMVKTKITQSELGIQEDFARAIMWGNVPNGGLLTDNVIDSTTGAIGIDPLPKLVEYNPTSLTVGNIAEGTYTWWKNQSRTSTATTYSQFLLEMLRMYNTVGFGTGGPCDLIITDQVTQELYVAAYMDKYKRAPDDSEVWPGMGVKFKNATIIVDDKVPDVANGVIPTYTAGIGDPASLSKGTMYFLNTKFWKIRYMEGRDFEMLKDEKGNSMFKPVNQDARIGHIGWMGNVTINQRRKQGVIGNIARTLN